MARGPCAMMRAAGVQTGSQLSVPSATVMRKGAGRSDGVARVLQARCAVPSDSQGREQHRWSSAPLRRRRPRAGDWAGWAADGARCSGN